MSRKLIARFRSDEGATAVEYGLLVALIAAVIIGVVTVLGEQRAGRLRPRSAPPCRDPARSAGRGPPRPALVAGGAHA